MHNSCSVSRFQSCCNLIDQRQGFLSVKAARSSNSLRESLALQELHAHQDDCAFTRTLESLMPKKIKYSTHVRVGHPSRHLHFAYEACKSLVLLQELRSDGLDRQVFLQSQILCFIYLAHSTGSNEAYDTKSFGQNLSWGKSVTRRVYRPPKIYAWHCGERTFYVFMLRQLSSDFLARGVVRPILLREVCTIRGIALQCTFMQILSTAPPVRRHFHFLCLNSPSSQALATESLSTVFADTVRNSAVFSTLDSPKEQLYDPASVTRGQSRDRPVWVHQPRNVLHGRRLV